ncbi:MAG: hypothetical protein EHM28_06605 [Spirochaetaceae bacterium]|nr:MAG: hypothetical protein EHM28_06605 [Spirochaetaceae bacterium]
MDTKKAKLVAVAAGVVLVLVLGIAFVSSGKEYDIAGKYEVLIAGEPNGTTADITVQDNSFVVTVRENESVLAAYIVRKPVHASFTIEHTEDGGKANRYELKVADTGLEGSIWIPTLGWIRNVKFRKI